MKTEKKNKVVFVSYYYWPPHFGGELFLAIQRLQNLAGRGHEVVSFTGGVQGYSPLEVNGQFRIERSPITGKGRVAKRINRLIFWLWVYLKFIFEKDVAVLHSETLPGVLGWIDPSWYRWLLHRLAHLKGAKVVQVHSLADTEEEFFTVVTKPMKHAYDETDIIVGVGPAIYDSINKVYPDKALLIPNAARDDIFLPLNEKEIKSMRISEGIAPDETLFIYVGSYERRKGLDLVLKSFEEHADELNWKLWLVGPYRVEESQYVRESEVRELLEIAKKTRSRIKHWGKIEDRNILAKIIGSADVYLLPTRREGMPIGPMEAMSTSVPVIVSEIQGVTTLAMEEGKTGLFSKPGDVVSLSKAMVFLSQNPYLRKEMGQSAARLIRSGFSWKQHVDKWEDLYFGN